MLLRPGASHAAALPGSLSKAPYLDAWIRIDADGRISVFTGKAELGQGIKTAIVQVAAEELKVEPVQIKLVTADTQLTANEQYTAGSHSLQDSGTAVRNAAAQVREILVGRAAERLALSKDRLRVARGIISADDGRALNYGQLVEGDILHIEALPTSPLTPPDRFTQMGKSLPRIDIPAKVTGGAAYVQDMRLPGMVHELDAL
jgi:CO/xanthine dehydrogenase Mo-binding subunit